MRLALKVAGIALGTLVGLEVGLPYVEQWIVALRELAR